MPKLAGLDKQGWLIVGGVAVLAVIAFVVLRGEAAAPAPVPGVNGSNQPGSTSIADMAANSPLLDAGQLSPISTLSSPATGVPTVTGDTNPTTIFLNGLNWGWNGTSWFGRLPSVPGAPSSKLVVYGGTGSTPSPAPVAA